MSHEQKNEPWEQRQALIDFFFFWHKFQGDRGEPDEPTLSASSLSAVYFVTIGGVEYRDARLWRGQPTSFSFSQDCPCTFTALMCPREGVKRARTPANYRRAATLLPLNISDDCFRALRVAPCWRSCPPCSQRSCGSTSRECWRWKAYRTRRGRWCRAPSPRVQVPHRLFFFAADDVAKDA